MRGSDDEQDLAVEYAAILDAFAQPALSLLHRSSAAFVVTVFETGFAGEKKVTSQPRLRRHVQTVLDELGSGGVDVTDRAPAELCTQWVRDGWLISAPRGDGDDVFELTAAALDALRMVAELARPLTVNPSRVQQILALVEQAAQRASGDRDARIVYLENEILRLQGELDRLRSGEDVEVGSYGEMADRYDQITRELGSLPADFRRVRELIESARRDMSSRVLAGEGTIGGALREALTRATGVLDETAEGRAFIGVRDLLQRDASRLRDLRRNAQLVLAHEFADALEAGERREFADVAAVFNSNIEMVMGATRELSTSVQDVTARHVRGGSSREVSVVLREARVALTRYAGERVGGMTSLARVEIVGVTRGLYDPDLAPPPRPLEDFAVSSAVPSSRQDLARWGGPHMVRLARHVDLMVAVEGGPVPLSLVWRESSEDLRRAVEISGYLTLAARLPGSTFFRSRTEVITTTRPDGTSLNWEVPLVEFESVPGGGLADG